MKPTQIVPTQPVEKKVKVVFFVADAVINFNYMKQATSELYEINIVGDLVLLQDKGNKTQYMVPLSNVRTVVFQ